MNNLSNTQNINIDSSQWIQAVARYKQVICANVGERVAKMSTEDINRYNTLHNTPSASRENILSHMLKNMNCDFDVTRTETDSHLLHRLLGDKQALIHIPPKSFGKSWYELVEDASGDEFECFASVYGLGRRKRDVELKVWLFEINECLWECCGGSPAGLKLIELDQQWSSKPNERNVLWQQIQELLEENISFTLRYGTWENQFHLRLKRTGALSSLQIPHSRNVFEFTRFEPNFPFSWRLKNRI